MEFQIKSLHVTVIPSNLCVHALWNDRNFIYLSWSFIEYQSSDEKKRI